MLKLVPLHEDLVVATTTEILASAAAPDLSLVTVVTPSARFHAFLRQELARRLGGAFFLPRLLTVEGFIDLLFRRHFPGQTQADDAEAVHVVFEICRECFGRKMYGAEASGHDFAAFYPRGRQILAAVEEILTEGGDFKTLDREAYSMFAELGDYHQAYKEFIKGLPRLTSLFLQKLEEKRLATRGRQYHAVAHLARSGALDIPPSQSWIFSGLHALNASERDVLKHFFAAERCSLLLHTDPAQLGNPASPFFLHQETIATLGLSPPPATGAEPFWHRLAAAIHLHDASGTEGEMIGLHRLLEEWLAGAKEEELIHTAVALPESSALIPFVQNAVSRFAPEAGTPPFNITMGFPFGRTPLFQLLDAMLRLRENASDCGLASADYLSLVRHPYVKLWGGKADSEDPLILGIHWLEEIIAAENLIRFRIEDLEGLVEKKPLAPGSDPAAILERIRHMHQAFVIPAGIEPHEVLDFLLRTLASLSQRHAPARHLFIPEYLALATDALEKLCTFCRRHADAFGETHFPDLAGLIRHFLASCHIPFVGSPLKGVQVMGMLEFRGLSFRRLAVADAVEGIVPPPRKYDPLLPYDIRRTLRIRHHHDWQKLFALHFFSMVGAAKEVHIFSPRSSDGDSRERSRFVEWLQCEIEKAGCPGESIRNVPAAATPYVVHRKQARSAAKDAAIREKMESLPLTPSALETYLRCPLRFYYRHVLGLKEKTDPSGEADAGAFGTIVHDILREIYARDSGSTDISATELEAIVDVHYVRNRFEPQRGLERMRRWVLLRKLRQFLDQDRQRMARDGVKILRLESESKAAVAFAAVSHAVAISGRIDRLEQQGSTVRVVDYKTGSPFTPRVNHDGRASLAGLRRLDEAPYLDALANYAKNCRAFQIMLYLQLVAGEMKLGPEDLEGSYVFLREGENPWRPIFARSGKPLEAAVKRDTMERFRSDLEELVADLFLRDTFLPNRLDSKHCSTCPYAVNCGQV